MVNNAFFGLIGIFIAALTAMQTGTPVSLSNSAQLGATAAAISRGKCEEMYRACMSNPIQTNKQRCENVWETCVRNKCVDTEQKGGIRQCPEDPDCESSCTEFVTSKDGLLWCCYHGPQHKNSCPKKIDGECSSAPTPQVYPGPKYNEWDKVPALNKLNYSKGNDSSMEIRSQMKYPEGTTFSENGMPSNPPSPNPIYPGTIYTREDIQSFADQSPEVSLPPEYQPSLSYQPPLSPDSFANALAFNNNAYLSTQGATPPSGLSESTFGSEGIAPPSKAFDYGFRAEPNKLSVVAPVVHSVPFVPLSTFSQTPISLVTTMGAPIQQPAPAQSFWGRIISLFGF